jgi:ABC-type glycerol-3-phosphate transport system permease component
VSTLSAFSKASEPRSKAHGKSAAHRLGDAAIMASVYAILIIVSAFMILPFIWMLSTSIKLPEDVFGFPPQLIPSNPTLINYQYLLQEKNLLGILLNTFIVAGGSTLLRLFFCSLGGYAFAKYTFPGRKSLFMFLLATMAIPGAVTLVPVYVIMRELKFIDTFWALIIPGAANAFGIFFLRQYISSISNELIDAARIDGATEFGIYRRVILPIIMPGLISIGIVFFMGSWNDYFGPLVFLKSPDKFTLPLAIASFGGAVGLTNYNAQMAMSVISIIPLLIVFLIFQRRFVDGITAGAIKG